MSEGNILNEIAEACGGTITEVGGPLSDGTGFAVMSMPLPKTHWIYEKGEDGCGLPAPMPFRMGSEDDAMLILNGSSYIPMDKRGFAERIRVAGKYAVRASTMHGTEMDFDPDAMLQNLVVGMLGLWTKDGLGESFDNPPGGGRENWKAPERKSDGDALQPTGEPCL